MWPTAWTGGLPEAELQCWSGDSPATGSEQSVDPHVMTLVHTHFFLPHPLILCSFLVQEVGSWMESGGLFLLRGKEMTPVEVMSFPKVTEL